MNPDCSFSQPDICTDCIFHLGDQGTNFTITTLFNEEPADLSNSSVVQVIFCKPDGSTITDVASLYLDGVDGRVYYTVADGLLDQVGTWHLQAFTQSSSGTFYSDIYKFKVLRNVE